MFGNQCYFKKISAIIAACIANPTPMVMMFSISLFKMALINSKTNPAQTIRIISTPGSLSAKP